MARSAKITEQWKAAARFHSCASIIDLWLRDPKQLEIYTGTSWKWRTQPRVDLRMPSLFSTLLLCFSLVPFLPKHIVRVVALDTNWSSQPIARASQGESASYSDQKERDAQPKALALSCLALKMLER